MSTLAQLRDEGALQLAELPVAPVAELDPDRGGTTSARWLAPDQNFCHQRERTSFFPYHLVYGEVGRDRRPYESSAQLQLEFPTDLPTAYHLAMRPVAKRLEAMGGKWGRDRARSIRLDPGERVSTCEQRRVTVSCGCRHVAVPVPCGLRWLCPRCQRREARKREKRFRRAMRMHYRAAYRRWQERGRPPGARPEWRLVSLSVRHSGELALDRRRLVEGWKRLRQWLWKRVGRFPFALVWEFTAGSDGRGHLHAHVAALWPFVDYNELRAEWLRACPESTGIDIKRRANGRVDASHYLAKYASKGVDVEGMPHVLAAGVIAANYGKRLVTTSHRFYRPQLGACPTCGQKFGLVKLPEPLRLLIPYAVWDAEARGNVLGSCRAPPRAT